MVRAVVNLISRLVHLRYRRSVEEGISRRDSGLTIVLRMLVLMGHTAARSAGLLSRFLRLSDGLIPMRPWPIGTLNKV
jgi:hypothetical protein